MKINIELTLIQKKKVRTLIEHARKDISLGANGTYRVPYTIDSVDEEEIRKAEAAIDLLEELAF